MSSIHLELLDKNRRDTFSALKIFGGEGVLAGGTALSLQIGHRHSFDFDIFLEREVTRKDFLKLKSVVEIKSTNLSTADQLDIVTTDGINITLLNYYHKPLFEEIPTASLPLQAVKDIALDKAFTIGRRAVWRDYVDLFFILEQNHTKITGLVNLAQKKFGVEFNPKLFLEQLVYFKDLQITKISFVEDEVSPEEIQNFLKGQARKFVAEMR